ncbi:hypothetical protein [Nonomuraea jiangxiensis]|uniref:hypothetical protein n=1 Tax=Nonomuraea jiangxiensis TaxID=633440 RepID=UPI00115FE4A8|nr:hypothetical protein [Nonomuraea jiangxiensis]
MVGRSRHARRRSGPSRLTVGALALALAGGGAGLLLSGNGAAEGTFGGALTVAGSVASDRPVPAAAGGAGRAGREDRASASPGDAGAATGSAPRAGAEAQVRRREIRKTPPSATAAAVKPDRVEQDRVEPSQAEPNQVEPGRVEPGQVEPGLVDGIIDSGEPPPNDSAGFKADGPSRHTDRRAYAYFRTHWGPKDKAMKRLKEIRTVGGYLRIYTDMPDSAANSAHAITLCKRGLEYLRAAGVADPVVFVQAEFGGNGNPVLANVLGPADRDCRVTHPTPD